MKKSRGTITFFMSILYLTLISFGLAMVEAYRIQYLYAKQEDIGRLAIHNLKADYLGDIFEEYGLLFYHDGLADGQESLRRTFEMGFSHKPNPLYFQDLYDHVDSKAYYHFPFFDSQAYSYQKVKQELDYDSLKSGQQEALLYAKDRLPFTMAGDWLEKIEVWKKGARTDEWTKKKEDLLKDLAENDRKLLRLYEKLDGVVINQKTHLASQEKNGINFFNLRPADISRKIDEINRNEDIPDKVKEAMIGRQFSCEEVLEAVATYIQDGIICVNNYWPLDPDASILDKIEIQKEFREAKKENEDNFQAAIGHYQNLTNDYYDAVRTASEIVESYKDLPKKLNQFLEELEAADISFSIKESMTREVQTILHQCDIENASSRIGNFKYLKEKLVENQEAFVKIQNKIDSQIKKAKSLLTTYEAAKKNDREWDNQKITDFYQSQEQVLAGQSGYFYFPLSYAGYQESTTSESKESLVQKKNTMEASEDMIEANLAARKDQVLNYEKLPSLVFAARANSNLSTEKVTKIDERTLDLLAEGFRRLTDQVILNEYYFMVFSHFALQAEDDMAISGYVKSDHARDGELEYLLFGQEEGVNRALMIASLFAARLMFNIISLLADAAKMEMVSGLATAVAGWWSFGVGTAILVPIIVGLWAGLETSVDIFMLFRGKRVPLIKTPSSWYTSLEGALSGFVFEAIDAMAEGAEKVLEEGIEEFQAEINHISYDLSTDIRDYIASQVAHQADELKAQVQTLDSDIRSTLARALNRYGEGKKDAKTQARLDLIARGLSPSQADMILNKTFGRLDRAEADLIRNNYTQRIEKIEEAIDRVKTEVEAVLNEARSKGQKAIKDNLNEVAKEVKNMGKEAINKYKENFKQRVDEKFFKNKNKNPVGEPTAKDLRDFIGLTYVDYLRLFLLLGDTDTKWLRAMDLIQQNQQQKTPDFYLVDCERRFKIESGVDYQPVLLPFAEKGFLGDWFKGKYQINVVSEGGY